MARLTNKEYLLRRKFLQALWEHEKGQNAFSYLDPNRQMILHSYYATAKHEWTDEQVLEYRKTRSNSEAFSAGKAFNELYRIVTGQTKVQRTTRVLPLVRPDVDIDKLARVFIMIAKDMTERNKTL